MALSLFLFLYILDKSERSHPRDASTRRIEDEFPSYNDEPLEPQ